MISRTGYGVAGQLLLAAAVVLLSAPVLSSVPAKAQAAPSREETAAPAVETETTADPDDADAKDAEVKDGDVKDADIKEADIQNLDWSQLNVDAATLATTNPTLKARSATRAGTNSGLTASGLTWSSNDKANGSAVSVKQPISSFWDTRVGADMTVTRQPATMSELLSEKAANGGNEPQSSGTAWAAITAPGVATIWDKTAVEARVDPAQDQSKLGTSLSKSVPLGDQASITLQNGYNVIEQGGTPAPGVGAGLGTGPGGRFTRNYETEQSAKLSIADTGTSFSAGQTLSTSDDKWLRRIGAEQKLFGGVSISGSISETPLGVPNKSITAGFKHSW